MSFGVVTFYNESGPIKRVVCETPADYWREMEAGAAWADSEPRRPRDVVGERTAPALDCQNYERPPLDASPSGHKRKEDTLCP